MRYIAEKERKFIDKLALKVYHSIYPINQALREGSLSQIISLDNKILSPDCEKIQQTFSFPSSVFIIIIISGTLSYSDSLGFNKILSRDDAVIIENRPQSYQNSIRNLSMETDAEFMEVAIASRIETNRHTISENNRTFIKNCLNNFFPSKLGDSGQEQKGHFYKAFFERGSHFVYPRAGHGDQIALFILKGEVKANGIKMKNRDTLIISDFQSLSLYFSGDTSFLLLVTNIIHAL